MTLDFVINYLGDSTILEVKARDGNAKSAKTVMAHLLFEWRPTLPTE